MKLFEHPDGWRWRWMQSKCGDLLHRVRSGRVLNEQVHGVGVRGSTLCGIKGNLYMPGFFSRTGAPRCKVCCKILCIPEGAGAPANAKNESSPWMKWMDA